MYLHLLTVTSASLLKLSFGCPLCEPILPAEGQPVPRELCGLHERKKSQVGAPVIRNINGQLLRGVIVGHDGEGAVDGRHRWLLPWIRGADEHVEGRKVVADHIEKAVGEFLAADGAPPEGLGEGPDEGQDEVGYEKEGGGDGGGGGDVAVEESDEGGGVEEGVEAVEGGEGV